MNKFIFILIIIISISSCRTQKDVLYFQNINEIALEGEEYVSPKLQTGDVLTINVSAFNKELVEPFNLGAAGGGGAMQSNMGGENAALNPNSYLIDSDGNINMPMLGIIEAAGKTRMQLTEVIQNKVSEYIENPMVNIRVMNFKVVTLGEFNSPGVVNSGSEKLSIIEVIAQSGGLSFYAIQDSIMLIRTSDGERSKHFLNLQDANLINSEYYYMRQNDMLYAMPTKSKAMEFNTQPITATLTVIGFITAMIALFR